MYTSFPLSVESEHAKNQLITLFTMILINTNYKSDIFANEAPRQKVIVNNDLDSKQDTNTAIAC